MADEGELLVFRAHHVAGGIAQRDDGQIEGVAQLQEAGGLVGGIAVDRPAQMRRVVGYHPNRATFDTGQSGHHAVAEPLANLEH